MACAEARRARAESPYPPSRVIKQLAWAPKGTIVRMARGSDNFPLTWADDGHLYTTWGDGWGFKPRVDKKLSMGFAKIIGPAHDFRGVNVRSPTGETYGDGRTGKKGWGILCVRGVLYLWMGHADQRGGQAQLAWSTDHANSWTSADWKFAEFGLVGLVNFARDYQGARDRYVYAYSHDGPKADTPADRFVLMRVPADRITRRGAYEFFARLDARGDPVWTSDVGGRGAIFEHRGACLRSAMTYNAALGRYLWWQQIPRPPGAADRADTRFCGGFGIYDAPEPWGPWTTVYFTDNWDVGPGEHADFPSKWIRDDGRTLYLAFSGDDSFSVRKATLRLAESAEPGRFRDPSP